MNWWQRFWRRNRMDEELEKEVRFHLDKHAADLMARGVKPAEARRQAALAIGGAEKLKEQCRDARGTRWLEDFIQDLRFAIRTLRVNPGFAAVAVLTLALGIGANTAIFQLLDTVRLRTLPVQNPQELRQVNIDKANGRSGAFVTRYPALTNTIWEQIRARQQGFSGILAWAPWPFNIADSGEVQRVEGIWVSGDFFNVLGVAPLLGRVFTEADDRRGCSASGAVVSYSFWQREYGGQPDVVGKQLHVNHHPFEIIGVTPASFYGVEVGRNFDVAIPICSEPIVLGQDSGLDRRDYWWLTVVGRLKPGWTDERTAAQLRAISPAVFDASVPAQFDADDAKHFREYKLGVFPGATGNSELRSNYQDPLALLLGLSGLVLLIACGNLANLLLARASTRGQEMAVRQAMGASRLRLVRQLLTESLLISAMGAAIGALVARWLAAFLVSFLSTQREPLFVNLDMDWKMLGFTAGLAILTCVIIGVTPALRATQVAPAMALRSAGRGLTASRERFGLRKALVVSQVALSLVLVTGAALFARSLSKVMTENAGFVQDKILVADVDFTRAGIPPARQLASQLDILDRLRHIPGVASAAATSIVPVSGSSWNQYVLYSPQSKDTPGMTNLDEVSDGFFATMGIPLIEGRDFAPGDAAGGVRVAIVNQKFAEKYFAHQNSIGKRFSLQKEDHAKQISIEIVGLVGNSKYDDMHSEIPPEAYLPLTQEETPGNDVTMMIRSERPLETIRPAISEALTDLNPDLRLSVFRTSIRESLLRDRLMAMLSGFFGLLAALLASVGLYGVISYTVTGRRNEFGIRMALGAQPSDILRIVMREAGVLLAIGILVGAALALAGAREAKSLIYGMSAYDPLTLLMAVVTLGAVATAASSIPALRASHTDPAAALREE
ncbi:MAG TPA: ABC transporter permease [Candidatus Limnocylindrales bacterium]|nr:ABC transporter permease [Candidatus Limnocylindrales bacterium]